MYLHEVIELNKQQEIFAISNKLDRIISLLEQLSKQIRSGDWNGRECK